MTAVATDTSSDAASTRSRWSFDQLDARLAAVLGAAALGLTGPLIALSGLDAGTSSLWRASLAVLLLVAIRFVARRRAVAAGHPAPKRGMSMRITSLAAGVFLGLDMVLWSQSILAVGAGIATVVVNVQVIVVPLLSAVLLGERIRRSFWFVAPVLLGGVALAGGIVGQQPSSSAVFGTITGAAAGIAYAGYLLLLRRTSHEPAHRLANLTDNMIAAALVALIGCAATGHLTLWPGWAPVAWLFVAAVTGHVIAWLLVGSALPRLSASTGSTLLLTLPIFALAFSAVLLGERPTASQLAGSAIVLGAIAVLNRPSSK
ncbi:DMT family transporter [Gordonia sp. TBRC 11910]|uniref:DMT family transporter n=1 Tax=Gordonia asplenii TaxID=2725283 RepID=A0A848L345_9ACTN|nr:DMT family transporter [Gordonia asplenii]NMO05186.1 DMT family transporter [Gordonia asplenii]